MNRRYVGSPRHRVVHETAGQELSAVFGQFVRARTDYVAKQEGTGLGLAIVKKIMEDHGGQLLLGNGDSPADLPGAKAQMIFPATTE